MKNTIILILTVSFLSCGKKTVPLTQPFESVKEMVEYHLRCIEKNDAKCFSERLLTYQEFQASVYKELPEGKDKVSNIDQNVYWGWILPDRKKSIKKLFERYGGTKILSYTIGEPKKTMQLDSIKLHRDVPIFVNFQDAKTGKTETLSSAEVFKAIVELNGKFKLWSMNYE